MNKLSAENYERRITNIVYMGMGEPLMNYPGVMQSIGHITSPNGLGMASRRITVSTVGVVRNILKLAEEGQVQFGLIPACCNRCQEVTHDGRH